MNLKYIDISTFQKNVDYQQVKDDGVQGVILRIGHTGYSNKDMVKDALFEEHYKGFKKVGLPIGVYWFSRATTILEAINEAKKTLEFLKDKTIELPIFWDTEDTVYQNKIDKYRLTSVALAYLDHIYLKGYKVGTYASTHWLNTRLDMSKLEHYEVWVAQYSSKVTYKGRYDMWQYSSVGRVKGIKGNVDMNICYTDYLNDVDDVKELDPNKRYLYLDKSVLSWRVYPLDKPCLIVNAIGKLAPSRFGGLRYEILQDYGNGCYKIDTKTYGLVKIYAGKNTKHVIRNY